MALTSQICLLFIFRLMSICPVRHIDLKQRQHYTDYGRCGHPLFIVAGHRLLIKRAHIEAPKQMASH